ARARAPIALALGPLLAMPALAASSVVLVRPNVATPSASLGALERLTRLQDESTARRAAFSRANRERLVAYLSAHREGEKFLAAVPNAVVASPLILATGQAVLAIGGYLGDDPALSTDALSRLRDEGALRYVVLGGFTLAPGKQKRALADVERWVRANGRPVDRAEWAISSRRSAPDTSSIPYRSGWLRLECQELFDIRPK
ncbi:MAG: hypothetical protein JSS20_20925, partial [Proteobacteria bacterium]|nr:hypothetical protein [Pseudomonadota bacterium]